MSSRYYFSLADASDDQELRSIIRNLPMDGSMQIAFHREPNFFAAERVGSLSVDVITGRERETDRIVGFGSRSLRRVFVNGAPTRVGYLASLRAIPDVRGGTLLARGYRALRELHSEETSPYCFTTILEENQLAKKTLASNRGGLPVYEEIGGLNTYAVNPRSGKRGGVNRNVTITRGSRAALNPIISFLNQYNKRFQFAPCYEVSDFEKGELFPDFSLENFYVASFGGSILGVAGVWDQSRFKQTTVAGYSGALSWLRPLYNTCAFWTGHPPLPNVGEWLRSFYVSFVAIDPVEPEILSLLLDRICLETRQHAYSYFLIGFNEKDPLCEALSGFRYRSIKSRLYRVYWPETRGCKAELDGRMPHLEISTL